jgi:hypothetical protein
MQAPQSNKRPSAWRRLAALLGLGAVLAPPASAQTGAVYHGMCDASAAVALDAQHFVVANDEDNVLRVYRRGQSEAVSSLPLQRHLGADKESDIEGAALIGQRIYWIASHGRNASGKERAERYRFFATDIDTGRTPPTLQPAGTPQSGLLAQMVAAVALKPLRLDEAARLAPEADGGLNIEGLADTSEGGLLIGLRGPLRDGRALLLPLANPAQVLSGQPADFGAALRLDLGGRGVRSLERIGTGYLIVAGPVADQGDFLLYRWSGLATDTPQSLPQRLGTLRPEALFAWPDGSLQLLSDDGGVRTDGIACKDRPPAQQRFRSIEIKL